jgi:hypothetical protein
LRSGELDQSTGQQWGAEAPRIDSILDWARTHRYVVFTHDLDFGILLSLTQENGPSVIQVRALDTLPEALGPRLIQGWHSQSDHQFPVAPFEHRMRGLADRRSDGSYRLTVRYSGEFHQYGETREFVKSVRDTRKPFTNKTGGCRPRRLDKSSHRPLSA